MKKSTKPQWRKTAVQGLYEYRPPATPETVRGTFYSRFSVNGKSTFRSLETRLFEHAKIKHAKRMADVEKDRQRGGDLGSDFKTLGGLQRAAAVSRVFLPGAEENPCISGEIEPIGAACPVRR